MEDHTLIHYVPEPKLLFRGILLGIPLMCSHAYLPANHRDVQKQGCMNGNADLVMEKDLKQGIS